MRRLPLQPLQARGDSPDHSVVAFGERAGAG